MKYYPVGATWEGEEIDLPGSLEGNQHRQAEIMLFSRDGKYEVWHWGWNYADGSNEAFSFDWGTSYASCKAQIPFACRMRRVK